MKYLVLSSFIMTLVYVLYISVLKKESFHQLNRWYLLIGLSTSLLIPLLPSTFSQSMIGNSVAQNTILLRAFDTMYVSSESTNDLFSWSNLYWVGVAFMLAHFIWKLSQTLRIAFLDDSYLTKHPHTAFSFFKSIRIGHGFDESQIQMITDHEKVHKEQFHTLDILFVELVKVFFWFNPFIYLLSNELQLLHEFIADEKANRKYGTDYQHTLLNQAIDTKIFPLTNSFFNQPIIKQRIMKMNVKQSSKHKLWLYALAIPVIGLSITMHACSEESAMQEVVEESDHPQQAKEPIQTTASDELDVHPTFVGGEQAFYSFLGEVIQYPEELKELNLEPVSVFTKFIIDKDGSVKNVEVIKSDDERFNESALAAVNKIPNWEPALKDGKPVAVEYNLPIRYTLQ